MNERYSTPWWAPEGDGPIGCSPDLPQLSPGLDRLKNLCKNESIYAIEDRFGGTRYGKVEIKQDRIWISSFHQEEPEAKLIHLKELLSKFNHSLELPRRAFFKLQFTLDSWHHYDGEIIVEIETYGQSPRVQNFLLLCSALKEHTFKGMDFVYSNTDHYEIMAHCPHVVEGVGEDQDKTPINRGDVYGTYGMKSAPRIHLRDWPACGGAKIGDVVVGLQKLLDMEQQVQVYHVEECGLII